MREVAIALAAVAVVTGCASASKTYGPDGKEAYSINCSARPRLIPRVGRSRNSTDARRLHCP